ncbi:MAG: thiol reductase thioredoxin [Deltaproteobacteria bacterium]|nr:thiol reductase thioredoxin [Deltaproteobacteria bacterium]
MEKKAQLVVRCSKCGAKNRVSPVKMKGTAKCGKCGTTLEMDRAGKNAGEYVFFRCTACGTRNRIPLAKIDSGPKCGKCGAILETKELFVSQPLMVTDSNFDNLVLKSPLPVLLFAWAPWCPTCRTFIQIIDDYAKDAKGKIRVGKLNVDSNQALSSKYNILSVPQILIFDNGHLKQTLPGAMQKHEIMIKMAPYL